MVHCRICISKKCYIIVLLNDIIIDYYINLKKSIKQILITHKNILLSVHTVNKLLKPFNWKSYNNVNIELLQVNLSKPHLI